MIYPLSHFPQIGDTGEHILLTCDCKSAEAVAAAGGVVVGAGAGAETYTAEGILLGSNTLSLNFTDGLTTAEKAKMENGFTMTCWIESGWFDVEYTAGSVVLDQEYIMGCYNTKFLGLNKSAGANDIKFRNENSAGFSASSRDSDNVTRGSHTRVDFVKTGGKVIVYLDYFPFIIFTDGAMSVTPFDAFIGIGASQFGDAPQAHRVKDFIITTHLFQPPVSYGLTHICEFGHSYVQQGDYQIAAASNDGLSALSYASGSTVPGSGGLTAGYDLAMTPTIHKLLHRSNVGLGNGRLFNHSKGGTRLSDANGIAWQIAQGIANHSNVIDTAIIMVGANEIASDTGTWLEEYGPTGSVEDWESLFQDQIDALIAVGATKILLINQPYFSENHPTASAQLYRDRVDGCNLMIASLVTANTECYLVDAFSAFGGDQTMWGGFAGTDQVHPSVIGSNKIGKYVFDVLEPIFN